MGNQALMIFVPGTVLGLFQPAAAFGGSKEEIDAKVQFEGSRFTRIER